MPNRYPVYIVSKGRWANPLTHKALKAMGVPHRIIVEKAEVQLYAKTCDAPMLILPECYLSRYDTCDDVGDARSKGPGAARNYAMDHSISLGAARHWVMDDNLDAFHYLNRNEKFEVECDATIRAMEDFVDRYQNIAIAGPNYYSFAKKTDALPAFVLNTRIYSCLLIDNAAGLRWRGRYNEDTDLSLRALKAGLCTLQFNAFLCGKITTQRMRGGNTDDFYRDDGTLPKSQMLADLHPDVAAVVWKFGRWHHKVNYKPFKRNLLIPIEGLAERIKSGPRINDYGMVAVAAKGEKPCPA